MSIKLKINDIKYDIRQQIVKELCIYPKNKNFNPYKKKYNFSKPISPYELTNEYIYLPHYYSIEKFGVDIIPKSSEYPRLYKKFSGTLRDYQKPILKESIEILNKHKNIVLSLYVGFGKTCLAICLSTKIKLKPLIIIHRIILINQWKESIENYCEEGTKVQILDTSSCYDETADFYIINIINIPKFGHIFFEKFGVVIYDEIHLLSTDYFSKGFNYLRPRYNIALSATPYRSDGMDILIDIFFGTNKIIRKLNKEHLVYKVETEIKLEHSLNKDGGIDWTSVINNQADNSKRNHFIAELTKYIYNKIEGRNILILCKRVEQVKILEKLCIDKGLYTTSLYGNKKTFDKNANILIATTSKAGTGFDHPKLNTMFLCCDAMDYYIQYLGRVFRTKESPIIIDIVDNHPLLNKHYNIRKKVYTEHGGIIKNFFTEFPNFLYTF